MKLSLYLLLAVLLTPLAIASQENWPNIQERLFGLQPIFEVLQDDRQGDLELSITGPVRASSGAQVPITLTIGAGYVRAHVIIDNNPEQHAVTFTSYNRKTTISTRIRMETDSYVRVVGETSAGDLIMHKFLIRASGGCSGYMDVHDPELTKDLGKILYKKQEDTHTTRIKHPMFTGLQRDLDSQGYIPQWTVRNITWYQKGTNRKILQAKTYISMSQDPYIRFTYDGEVDISVTDTKDHSWSYR